MEKNVFDSLPPVLNIKILSRVVFMVTGPSPRFKTSFGLTMLRSVVFNIYFKNEPGKI